MIKATSSFVCQSCGTEAGKWTGQCENCGAWNTIVEETPGRPVSGGKGRAMPKGRSGELVALKGDTPAPARLLTGIAELDRVAGGGFVEGSGALIGGDPGIGKSTLLLQALAALALRVNGSCTFQARRRSPRFGMRAERLGLSDAPVLLASLTNVSDILTTLNGMKAPAVVVIIRSRLCGPR